MPETQFCRICKKNNRPPLCPGFLWTHVEECPFCKNKELITYNISYEDIMIITKISFDESFIEAMIDLKEKDPIEYQLKLQQFKANNTLNLEHHQTQGNVPKCPTCHSTKLSKVPTVSKAGSVFMFGLLSQKVKKTWHCDNCGYEW